VLGIPLCWAEWTMGRYGGNRGFNSAPGIYSVIWRHKLARYFGAFAMLIPLVIYMYYVLIEAWCLGYAWDYLVGNLQLGNDPQRYKDHFNEFIGGNADGFLYEGGSNSLLVVLAVVFSLNFIFIYRGLSKGIETFCKWAMPLMAVCALCVLVRVMTLDSDKVVAGLGAMWNPNPEYLWKPQTWLEASGQIFFSLSVGFGIIINYASYLRKNDDVALSGLTASAVNEFFEVCRIDHASRGVHLFGNRCNPAGNLRSRIQRLAERLRRNAGWSLLRLLLVLYALLGGDYQQRLDVAAGNRLLRGGARTSPARLRNHAGTDHGRRHGVRPLFF
jgi:SNF family Na+-dependent transporter